LKFHWDWRRFAARWAQRHTARAYVMQSGRIAIEGTAADLAASDEVRKAYLGM